MAAYDERRYSPPAPLAFVAFRVQQSDASAFNVPMLIDTGADVSLVPQSTLDQLGITLDSLPNYQVMGFNGATSFAHAVELDLIFLKRTVRGLYLVIDQDVGILGRDVINHVALLLDGPRLHWSEV